MTGPRIHSRRAPPWWPANEPWPPVGPRYRWARGRTRFVRRIGCLFGLLLFLSAIGAARLVSWAIGRAGLEGAPPALSVLAVITGAGAVLLAIFFGAMRRIAFPLGDVVVAADRVAEGDFTARIAERGPPFLRSVARAFNSMTTRLQSQERQRRELMADIAHELRTPLTILQGRLEALLDGVYPRDDEHLSAMLEDTRMLARLVEDFRTLAHAESGSLVLHKEPADVAVLLQDVVNDFAREAAAANATLHLAIAEDLPLAEIDPLRMREVVSNLLTNAIHHAGGGPITVEAEQTTGSIVVRVTDTGPGIPADDLARIFDRFYKGRESRGSGLGLTIARNLVVAHGGEIRAESWIGQGTTVTFTLPVSTAS